MNGRRVPKVRRLRGIGAAAGCGALVVLSLAACTSEDSPQARTARVERAAVTTGVSATGSMSAISQQNLGFLNGGRLTNVFVKVGDRVEPGQVLATVDDYALRQTVAQQQGELTSQQAALDRLVNSPVAEGAKDSLAQAEDILEATHRQNKAVLDADETAIDNAERQLAVDKKALETAEDRLEADKRACGRDSSSSRAENTDDSDNEDEDEESNTGASDTADSSGTSGRSTSGTSSRSTSGTSGSSSPLGSSSDPACSAVASDEAAVASAKQQVVSSRNALDSAKKQRDIDKASGDLAVENAQQGVMNARNDANSERSDRPFDIQEQRGAVASQRAAVAAAQRDLEDATLRAPVAGTVSSVNGVVGEFLAPSNGTSALAPGSGAAIPGVESGSAAAAAAGTVANPARPGGTQFLVLDNIDAFQVVVPFNESDAATIVPNQKVNVSVDAIPDVTLTGTVLSVAPTGTAISGVISYYVTMVVDKTDPRLKDGQTVRATVVTEEVDNVLTVPSAAVRQENGRATVTVLEADGTEKAVSFEPGMAGPDRTQVLSGLREGQQVVLSAAR